MKVQAIASVPRDWGFRLHWQCQREALFPLRLMPVEHGGAFWNESLETLIENALANDFDYILTLDFDTIFTRRHILMLLDLAKTYPHADAIVPWQIKRDSTDRIFGVRREDGTFRRRFDEGEFEPDLMPIDTGHFGLTLIKLSALDGLPRPLLKAVPDDRGQWGSECVQSDIYFWNQLRAHERKVFLATKVRVGHLQQMITWPTADFGIEQQYAEAFKHEGPPKSTI